MNNSVFRLFKSLDLILTIIISTALIIVVVKFNIFATIDGDIHLSWVYFWNQQVLKGQLYPRWFEEAFNGLGTTSFIFYPPLMRWISIPFGLLKLSPTIQIKATIILFLLINSCGVFKLSRVLFHKNLYSLIAIAIGIFNPFLLNEILKRGGFPSLCFLSLVPWLMISIIHYLNKPNLANFISVSLIHAAIFLTHVPSCLILVSTYTASLFILFIFSNKKFKLIIIKLLLAVVVALLIDGFFIMPILFDTHLVYQTFVPSIKTIQSRLFLNGIYKLQPTLRPSDSEAVIYKIFLFNSVLFLLTIFTAYPIKQKNNKNFLLQLQILIVGCSLLMTTEIAYPIYEHIKSFRKLQFSWRYLGLSSALIPYVTSYTFIILSHKFAFFKKHIITILIILIIVLFDYKSAGFILRIAGEESSFINKIMKSGSQVINQSLPSKIKIEKLNEQYYYVALQKKGAPILFLDKSQDFFPADVTDYIPKTVNIENHWLSFELFKAHKNQVQVIKLPQNYSNIEFIKGKGNFTIKQWGAGKRIFDVKVTQEAALNLKTFYYPGWKIKINSNPENNKIQSIMSSAEDGRIQLKLPQGIHQIEIYYQGTKAEQIGLLISIITIFILIIILFINKKPSKLDKLNEPTIESVLVAKN